MKQGSGVTSHCAWQTLGRTWRQASCPSKEEVTSYKGEVMSGWLTGCRGNQQRSMPLTGPFDKLS